MTDNSERIFPYMREQITNVSHNCNETFQNFYSLGNLHEGPNIPQLLEMAYL
jgi:hypothetical protein